MTGTDNHAYCSEQVYSAGAFHSVSCSRKAKLEREGKPYCIQHDPERVAAKRAARRAELLAESDRALSVRRWNIAAAKACEGLSTSLLENLPAGHLAQLLERDGGKP